MGEREMLDGRGKRMFVVDVLDGSVVLGGRG